MTERWWAPAGEVPEEAGVVAGEGRLMDAGAVGAVGAGVDLGSTAAAAAAVERRLGDAGGAGGQAEGPKATRCPGLASRPERVLVRSMST